MSKRRTGRPKCAVCRSAITHTPGKRTRVYCSDACKKRAQRTLARAADPARSGEAARALGKKTTEFPTPSDLRKDGASDPAKRDTSGTAQPTPTALRHANRRTLWKISGNPSCRGCGRHAMDPDSGVIYARTADGKAVVLGLLKCGKIWLCPVCSAKIRFQRSKEVTTAVVTWIKRGGIALLVTFTARHTATHRLADLMDAIQGTRSDKARGLKRKPGAYQRLITGGTWAGRPERGQPGIRDLVGYIGMIRATEVTLGQRNGWHPHIHAIVLLGGRTEGERGDKRVVDVFDPSDSAMRTFEDHFRGVWTSHLAKIDPAFRPSDTCDIPGCTCGGVGHGVDFKPLKTVKDAQRFGEYLAKTQDGKDPAMELTRGDLKGGRDGNMTPFQLLGRIGDLMGGVEEDEAPGEGDFRWCLNHWHEYEAATKGRRAIEWTRYLRPLLGLDGGDSEEDDLDMLFELDGASAYTAGARVEEDAYRAAAERGLDYAAIEAVEAPDGLDVVALTELVVIAGAPADSVRLLTAQEVDQIWQDMLAALAARREAALARRREEREREEARDAERKRRRAERSAAAVTQE
jgi:hypothetical protein